MQSQEHTSSRRRARAAHLFLSLALVGCAELGLPTQPAWHAEDATTAGGCAAATASRTETREDRSVERHRCVVGTARGGGRPPAPKR